MFQVSVNMTEYKCYSCDAESTDSAVLLAHTITNHPDKPLSTIWISPNSLKVWIADYEDADQVFDQEEVMSPTPTRL